ncbi:MAG: hypothetical protein KF782_33810 [Labilithrix sp.]|nr:hypothetical protein [Labilithrix sp.]
MYGQGHGYGHPYAPPPPPPRSGLSTLTIVLIVLGALTVLGGGACVVVGGLVYLGAKAEAEGPVADPSLPRGEATSTPGAPPEPSTSPTTEPAPLAGLVETADDDDIDDDGALGGVAPNDGASSGSASAPKKAGGGWLCNATGWVRVCGFANVCSNQMVSGLGSGADRFTASQSAKLACEGMARAKGGSTVCTVACSPR